MYGLPDPSELPVVDFTIKKSSIPETKNLSTCAVRSTDTIKVQKIDIIYALTTPRTQETAAQIPTQQGIFRTSWRIINTDTMYLRMGGAPGEREDGAGRRPSQLMS